MKDLNLLVCGESLGVLIVRSGPCVQNEFHVGGLFPGSSGLDILYQPMCVCVYMCVCVDVCVYTYAYICVCMCVCMCE